MKMRTTAVLNGIAVFCCLTVAVPGIVRDAAAQQAANTTPASNDNSSAPSPPSSPPSFLLDVMPVLSRSGCNQGACHGNLNGKGGFKLSLRGQDPQFDYQVLVRDQGGRRVDPQSPAQSLLLLKATSRLGHQGGARIATNSPEFEVLRSWIAAGAPASSPDERRVVSIDVAPRSTVLAEPVREAPLKVTARYSDGATRDITRLAAYEVSNLVASVSVDGVVRRESFGDTTVIARYLDQQIPVRLAFIPDRSPTAVSSPPLSSIDRHIDARLTELRAERSPPADAGTLIRRLYLDLTGVLPTADEAREFAADAGPDRVARVTDRLLARPEFSEHWALKWADLLRVEEKVLDQTGVDVFHRWIVESFAQAKPLDRFVSELLTSRGSTYTEPPTNFLRANREPTTRGENVARLFLGVRLQCAQCHNHPYDRWTQDDYFQWSALFARVDYQVLSNQRSDKLDKNEFNGEQVVEVKASGELKNPRTGKDATPRLLGADLPNLAPDADRLVPLAAWLTARDNRMFAAAQANFVWYHLLGRGLVEPIDDMRDTNPPSHPALLDDLARDFATSEFDVRSLARRIVLSRTYQTSSAPHPTNADDEALFARAIVKRWPAEKLLDAFSETLDVPAQFAGYPSGLRAGQIPGVRRARDRERRTSDGDRFLTTFGKPARLLACECERSNETTLNQAFALLSGDELNSRLAAPNNRLHRWAKSDLTTEQIVRELFWTALAREPSADEATQAKQWIERTPDRFTGLQDVTWAVLNSKAFLFRN